MEIKKFKELLANGFDVEFNIKDIFYSFTKGESNKKTYYFIGNENYTEHAKFSTIEEMLNYKIDGEALLKIIESIDEEEINY